jgi:hypothetical protein
MAKVPQPDHLEAQQRPLGQIERRSHHSWTSSRARSVPRSPRSVTGSGTSAYSATLRAGRLPTAGKVVRNTSCRTTTS